MTERPDNAPRRWRGQGQGRARRGGLNTKEHKERRDGMYRDTKTCGEAPQAVRSPDGRAGSPGGQASRQTATGHERRARRGRATGRGCNGGRARCPHRAARVMRGAHNGRRRWSEAHEDGCADYEKRRTRFRIRQIHDDITATAGRSLPSDSDAPSLSGSGYRLGSPLLPRSYQFFALGTRNPYHQTIRRNLDRTLHPTSERIEK